MAQLLQNAVCGTVLILAVAVLRGALRNRLLPEARLALWAVCLFRLLTPIAPASALSFWGLFGRVWGLPVLVPAAPAAPTAPLAPTFSGVPTIPLAPMAPSAPAAPTAAEIPWGAVLAAVWISVGAILATRYALAYMRTRRAVRRAVPLEREDARYAALPKFASLREGPLDGAPLTFGVVRPTVVLTPGLEGTELACVLAHEGVHARRRDNLWHYAAAAALTVFWWNPAVWLMARLIRRDVELSCDRAAVRRLGEDRRAEYAHALVTLSTQAEGGAFCHGFGPKRTEERIISVMKYKKATITGIALTLALVLTVTVGLASNPGADMLSSVSSVTVSTKYRTPVALQDCVLPERDSSELIRLINAYSKTVYPEGDTHANLLDVCVRLNCDDGGYYVLHYWYCSGFSWNPLHFGEDDYYSLLTHFDAAGNAGTTWKLDYNFDRPFIDWWTNTATRAYSFRDAKLIPDGDVSVSDAGADAQGEALICTREDCPIQDEHYHDADGQVIYIGYYEAGLGTDDDEMVYCALEDCTIQGEHFHHDPQLEDSAVGIDEPVPEPIAVICTREDCPLQPSVHFHESDGSVTYVFNDCDIGG